MKAATVPIPTALPAEVRLRGDRYVLRLLCPADAGALQAFFVSHTADTVRERYGYHVGVMTPERAAALVGVDQGRDAAFGLFGPARDGSPLHAVGRYCLDAGGRSAEFAVVVRESLRRRGIGGLLLRTLVDVARHRGLATLWGQILTDNGAMLGLARRLGFALTSDDDGRSVRATLALRKPAPGASR